MRNNAAAVPAATHAIPGAWPILPSFWLCGWIAFVAIASVVLICAYLPPGVAGAASLLCVGLAIHAIRRDALLVAPEAIVALQLQPGTALGQVQMRNGDWFEMDSGAILRHSVVSRWLLLIRVSPSEFWRPRYLVLLPDSLAADDARRARVWLKWARRE